MKPTVAWLKLGRDCDLRQNSGAGLFLEVEGSIVGMLEPP